MEYKDGRLHRTDYDEYGHKKTKFIYSYVLIVTDMSWKEHLKTYQVTIEAI